MMIHLAHNIWCLTAENSEIGGKIVINARKQMLQLVCWSHIRSGISAKTSTPNEYINYKIQDMLIEIDRIMNNCKERGNLTYSEKEIHNLVMECKKLRFFCQSEIEYGCNKQADKYYQIQMLMRHIDIFLKGPARCDRTGLATYEDCIVSLCDKYALKDDLFGASPSEAPGNGSNENQIVPWFLQTI